MIALTYSILRENKVQRMFLCVKIKGNSPATAISNIRLRYNLNLEQIDIISNRARSSWCIKVDMGHSE